jgi:regulator of CtrA degradation
MMFVETVRVSGSDVIRLNADPARIGRNFARSEAFRALFQEGMELVEEAAFYLDGQGRTDSRALPRPVAVAYASESMRLTTRLMQIASWLLVQRGVADGELTPSQAEAEKERVRLTVPPTTTSIDEYEALPRRLRELVGLATRLQARIIQLDQLLSQPQEEVATSAPNMVAAQLSLLQRSFGAFA